MRVDLSRGHKESRVKSCARIENNTKRSIGLHKGLLLEHSLRRRVAQKGKDLNQISGRVALSIIPCLEQARNK